jgi:hypothetical protein
MIGTGLRLVFTICLGGGIIWGLMYYSDYLRAHAEKPADEQVFQSEASITLVRYEDPNEGISYIQEALLKLNAGTPGDWRVLDSGGSIVARGSGDRALGAFHDLPNGNYVIEWSARDTRGIEGTVTLDFKVDWST